MKSYKLDDYESEITNVFLDKLTQKLNARQMVKHNQILLKKCFRNSISITISAQER